MTNQQPTGRELVPLLLRDRKRWSFKYGVLAAEYLETALNENDRLKQVVIYVSDKNSTLIEKMCKEHEEEIDERDELLREVKEKYIDHSPECLTINHTLKDEECNCGLDDFLDRTNFLEGVRE